MEAAQERDDSQSTGQDGGGDSQKDPIRARFDELSHRDQQKILDKHRDTEVEGYDWWEDVYEDFKDDIREKGIHVERMYFSGFWSQGDGASFEGHISDFPTFWAAHRLELPTVADFLAKDETNQITFRCEVQGRYAHSGCMVFSEYFDVVDRDLHSALEVAALDIKIRMANVEWGQFVKDATAAFRGHADDLYKRLETEHEHLTSDEQVLESLLANDLLEQEIEPYKLDCSEKGDEGTDSAAVQELLLRPAVVVPEDDGRAEHLDAGD